MQKINFQNLPSTTTPINATNLNAIQTNAETAINQKADLTYVNGSTPMGNVVVDSIRSKNMFNKNNILIKTFVYKDNGDISYSDDWSSTDFIEVEPNTSYIYSGVTNSLSFLAGTAFYNSSKTFISGIDSTTYSFTTPASAKYVRISLNTETPTQVQLETGTTATSYAPYQNLTGEENYSTNEQIVGTWINGKPIYKETQTTTGNSSNTQEIFHKDNIDTIIKAEGWARNGNDLRNVISNFYGDMGWSSQFYFSTLYGGLGIIECGNSYATFKNGATINMTLYYTKTTD